MKIQNETQLRNWPVFGCGGAMIGTVLSVRCEPDRYSPAWMLVRMRGLRRRLRAIPATEAAWQATGRLAVPYRIEQIVASPDATKRSLQDAQWCAATAEFYQHAVGA